MKAYRRGRDGDCGRGFPSWWNNPLNRIKLYMVRSCKYGRHNGGLANVPNNFTISLCCSLNCGT